VTARAVPALVIGGGPAGAAASLHLASAGLPVELIERSERPRDLVCGAFLGWDALAALRRLGLDPAALGARPIHRLRLVAGKRIVDVPLPRPAAGLSRRRLDEALLAAAADAGAEVRRGLTARAGGEDRVVRLDNGEEIAAATLFLATGKHELRGLARPVPKQRREGALGLRTSFFPDVRTAASLADTIELHPFNGGYAGLLLQEDGSANLCVSVAAERLRRTGGIPPLLEEIGREAPRLGERIAAADGAAWLSISNVPYGWRARTTAPGLYRLGDQAAVIASLAGDGIAIALASGIAAASAHAAGTGAGRYQASFARRASRPLGVAEVLRWAAERPLPRRVMVGLAGAVPASARLAARLTRVGAPPVALSGR